MVKTTSPSPQERDKLTELIKENYSDATDFTFDLIDSRDYYGNIYYIEFKSSKILEPDSFYYGLVDNNGKCTLKDDGESLVLYFETMLDERRNFLQRLGDFSLIDIVGAVIGILIVVAFVLTIAFAKDPANAVSKEYLALVSIVVGYYFGRNGAKS